MSKFEYEKPVPFVCLNCHEEIIGIRDVNGVTKVKCPHCGTVTVSRVMSRRHVSLDVYAPEGPAILQQRKINNNSQVYKTYTERRSVGLK